MKNISKYIVIIILFVLLFSCSNKEEEPKPLIEIYQLNKRIASYEGKAVVFTKEMTEKDSEFTQRYQDIIRRTADGNWTPNGGFTAESGDLKSTPIISNEQILGFDFIKAELFLKEEACNLLSAPNKLKDDHSDVQLVITSNKEPIMYFYKASMMSRWYIGNAYFTSGCDIFYAEEKIPQKKDGFIGPTSDNIIPSKRNVIPIFRDSVNHRYFEKIVNLKQDTAFYNAFKRAGKIIAE
ncbi:hypothetical protein BST92_03695 [Nonlabens arenilitoris]|uniref:Lipoprotein n=1 Tax=Nonlabens arenilitoris TaxID=1217969 RepID=A0A2S7U9Z9_9FLAO|nr:hypothetical protein [Nonlabens arenilitoris]PQJ31082.1 hypothetical protein BST92_03695 [Nonlabens arenilitoris]